jgi:hypothetical protein
MCGKKKERVVGEERAGREWSQRGRKEGIKEVSKERRK